MRPSQNPRVIIRHCDRYDPEEIRRIVREGLEELGLAPVRAHAGQAEPGRGRASCSRTRTRAPSSSRACCGRSRIGDDGRMTELAVGERCGITVPTRVAFDGAGYDAMLKRQGVKHYYFEEEQQVEIPLTHAGAPARLPVHARAGRARRLLRQLPQVQGAPVDDGDVLDEELHRHPGRPAPADRSRSPAQREDRRPPVHHPAAVHRDRRDHRRRGPHADADPVST